MILRAGRAGRAGGAGRAEKVGKSARAFPLTLVSFEHESSFRL